jgi:DNA-binding Xre family transcriptional regulator
MTDSTALREIIAKKGIKLKALASTLGITQYQFTKKIDNISEFKASEIYKLRKALALSIKEVNKIFFA